jgi:hypothetical protein
MTAMAILHQYTWTTLQDVMWVLQQDDGSYAGFDANEFTSHSGGKAEAVRQIKVR